jgi:ribonuclease inhibitor
MLEEVMEMSVRDETLIWFQEWVLSQNEIFNSKNQVIIESLKDSSGWRISIPLIGTEHEKKNFVDKILDRNKNDWIHCTLQNSAFEGFGGILNLLEILSVFRECIESPVDQLLIDLSNIKSSKDLHSLLKTNLKFPNFYGQNWDAFWDAISGLVELPIKIEFKGWAILEKNLPSDAKILKELLEEYNNQNYREKREFLFN